MTKYRWNAKLERWEFFEPLWGGWCGLKVTASDRSPLMTFEEGIEYLADPNRAPFTVEYKSHRRARKATT